MVSATHLYTLANAGPEEAAWLARVAAARCREALAAVERRLLAGTWPFGAERTERWFGEQFALKAQSLARFGLPDDGVAALRDELTAAARALCGAYGTRFLEPPARPEGGEALARARTMVLRRKTLGSPKPWGGSFALTAREQVEYERIIYGKNLDFMVHRICYWADGKRSVLDIAERLEIEMDELLRDTSISRTSSGQPISDRVPVTIDLEALLYLVDLLVANGYLDVTAREGAQA